MVVRNLSSTSEGETSTGTVGTVPPTKGGGTTPRALSENATLAAMDAKTSRDIAMAELRRRLHTMVRFDVQPLIVQALTDAYEAGYATGYWSGHQVGHRDGQAR
jgi:hypothetical protein